MPVIDICNMDSNISRSLDFDSEFLEIKHGTIDFRVLLYRWKMMGAVERI